MQDASEGIGPRSIILCADDYGMAPGVNAAIRDLIARRRINATSVMVGAPSFDRAAIDGLAALRSPYQHAQIGLHVTLTAPFRPLTKTFRPSKGGVFLPLGRMLVEALARRLDAGALEREVDAQFAAFAEAFGHPPDFVDGHQHVQLFPQVGDAVLSAAQRHAPSAWVRQCGRAPGSGRRISDPKALLLDMLSRSFRRAAASRGIATNPAFAGTYVFSENSDFATLFPRFLEGLPDGGLIMCHPGKVDPELERLDPVTHLRESEYSYFAGESFMAALRDAHVVIPDGHHLSAMRR